jgi:predicted peptidase
MRICVSLALGAALGLASTPSLAEQTAMKAEATIRADLGYLISTPPGYETSGQTYPLIVWLHGGDQGGSDIEKVRTSGLPALIESGRDVPFIVFSPQNPSEELLYPIEKVKAALDEVMSRYRVDRSRVSVVGYSRGGSGLGLWPSSSQRPLLPWCPSLVAATDTT